MDALLRDGVLTFAAEEAPIWGMLHLKYQERLRAAQDRP